MSSRTKGRGRKFHAGSFFAGGGFHLLRLLATVVPIQWLHAWGRLSAPILYRVLPGVRANLLDNARHILGDDYRESSGRDLAISVLTSFSRFVIELATSHRKLPADEELFRNTRGKEHYEAAKERGKGIIGVTLHLGNYEVGPMLLTRFHQPVAIVYNRDPSGVFERLRSARRREHGLVEIPIDESPFFGVNVLKVLREGGMALLAADLGMEVDGLESKYSFLGAKAPFLDWPARLSLSSGAPILPCFIVREKDSDYTLEISPPVFPDGEDVESIMQRLLPVFEDAVRRYPEQWLIIHRYWPADHEGEAA